MKELVLLRHAKAVPEHAGGDFNRPLARRGIDQVHSVAATLLAQQWLPDLALVSPAARTMQTALILQQNLGQLQIITDHTMYLASTEALLSLLSCTPADIRRLLLIGHNPGISDLGNVLTGEADQTALPTAGLLALQLDIKTWAQIKPGNAYPIPDWQSKNVPPLL